MNTDICESRTFTAGNARSAGRVDPNARRREASRLAWAEHRLDPFDIYRWGGRPSRTTPRPRGSPPTPGRPLVPEGWSRRGEGSPLLRRSHCVIAPCPSSPATLPTSRWVLAETRETGGMAPVRWGGWKFSASPLPAHSAVRPSQRMFWRGGLLRYNAAKNLPRQFRTKKKKKKKTLAIVYRAPLCDMFFLNEQAYSFVE